MDIQGMWDLFFDHPSDDDDEDYFPPQREFHPKIPDFFENIVSTYSLTDFKSHFRLEKTTYERLVQTLGGRLHRDRGAEKMSPDKQIAITLWVLGNQEVYRSVADRFGVCKDTVWNSVFEVAMLLIEDVHTYIKWPEPYEMINFEREFRALSGFPGVIGAIDGSHIAISAPIENSDNYINRKGYHSLVLQGICDYKLRFIDVFTGMCGSVHDARVWRLSDIKELITQDENRYFQNQYHLLADSAYPLSKYMLTPYRDNGHLNRLQRNFNTKLSKTRVVIERAFGMLKGRFRKLRYVYMYNTEMIPLIIIACCILHNICIENEDEPMAFDPIEMEINNKNAFINGAEKRDLISQLL
ncbi:putative nuclease HARBI1 isoform X1 [Temnothorax nylanderi]|uniref:putative nuclease HARBI1 isoform X1 n=1 Tax=Temnothorax nylanderi TaxID=102681 RepID=UPI003A861AAC